MEQLPIKIRTLRSVFGYSQEFIAFHLGISQAAYSKKENGQTQPSLNHLDQLAILYGVSLSDLLQAPTSDLLQTALSKK
jgi:transcriptional regulator with XRE-family HTH domain